MAYEVEVERITADDEKIDLLMGFADLVSVAISNSYYYGNIQKRLEECESKSNLGDK